jgi:hypothetical protein
MRITRDDCTGLVIDIQERLFAHMDRKDELLHKCVVLIKGLQLLEVPLMITEQYPKGLGTTIAPLREVLEPLSPVEKIAFSCCDEPHFRMALDGSGRRKVIICGIEAHVCVQQTVIDLKELGYQPVVVADCISSRNPLDREVSLNRMAQEGAVIATCESILFELARVAGTDVFKSISRLVK